MTSSTDQTEIWRSEIISIGSEIIMGVITDSNAAWIAEHLPSLGIGNYWTTAVGDNLGRISEALERAVSRSDIVITTGGLGPTDDDLTREAIARMLGETPQLIPELEEELRERFRGRPMPERNLKQATLIPSAQAIPNPRGTAPGWWTETSQGKVIISMPGVPREMFQMWENEAVPRLRNRMGGRGRVIVSRTLKTMGIGEGNLDELIDEYLDSANPKIGVYAKQDGTHVRINALGQTEEEAWAVLKPMEDQLTDLLGRYIWGYDDDTVPDVLRRECGHRGLSIAVLESGTGGHLADILTSSLGTDSFFKGGVVAPNEHLLTEYGVPPWTLEEHGAVSQETAQAMAEAIRDRLRADVGIGVTAASAPDPTGQSRGVTIFTAIVDERDRKVSRGLYPTNLQDMKWRVANAVLVDLLSWVKRR